jgi:hypothetical protein
MVISFQAISTAFTSHQQSSQQSNHPLYTEKTLVDFHYLLVVVLRQYESTINQFHNMKDSRTEVQLNLNVYSQLLWSLSTSPILRTPQLEKCMKTSNFTSSPAAGNLRLCQVVFSAQQVIDLQAMVQGPAPCHVQQNDLLPAPSPCSLLSTGHHAHIIQ